MLPGQTDAGIEAALERAGRARVYFGHQSVGANILEGVADLQRGLDRPRLRIAELGALGVPDDGGILLHSAIGSNGRPDSKCEDFRRVLGTLHDRIDMALFKFCYVDFDDRSHATEIFATYARTMDTLALQYPAVRFVHVTVPLRSIERGPGVWLREALGRRNRAKHANAARNEFNRLLRDRYAGAPVFDLAAAMSTHPDGRRETFELDGRSHECLVPSCTDDGGHLNATGRVHVAAAFVRAIAERVTDDR